MRRSNIVLMIVLLLMVGGLVAGAMTKQYLATDGYREIGIRRVPAAAPAATPVAAEPPPTGEKHGRALLQSLSRAESGMP